ncbi:GNAT superfamily N-acetyltransferase [Kutzneria viridogrisea]|uniref:GNAT superfamily N-acetyltransferase n=1 Tax=Kutzneria viridogrisea TaxID=47990 RepID=A0ABR6BZD5_9PSEU|nr:GNAT superfamily N-acetyltransferase [Kutzneria viridogrisea]
MHSIRVARAEDLEPVIALLARSQARPEYLIGYHGETPEELAQELAEISPDWASCTVLAERDGRLVGLLTVDVHTEQRRSWLQGPYAEVDTGWAELADALFAAASDLPVMRGVHRFDLFGHVRHTRLAEFAGRHGFTTGKPVSVVQLDGDALRELISTPRPAPVLTERQRRAVTELHEELFPDSYMTGTDLLGRTTVICEEGGYAAGRAHEAEYFVDFVGVEPRHRGRRLAARLVADLLAALAAEHGPRPAACATIALGNTASERSFAAAGFRVLLDLVSYQRVTSAA